MGHDPWPRRLLVAGLVLAVVGIALALPAAQLHSDTYRFGGEALQLAFGAETVGQLFEAWRVPVPGGAETGFTLQWAILFPGDTLLPIGYGIGLFGLLTLLAGLRRPDAIDRVRWLPIAAMAFDLAENQLMAAMLTHGAEGSAVPAALPLLTSLLAVAKYVCIAGLTPVVGLARLAGRWRATGPALRWVGAGLALLVPIAFAVRAAIVAWALHG